MNYDEEKIDECTLALLYLVNHDRIEGSGARAWKGFDWETMNRLHEKGYISNPIGKAKSVGMTEKGFLKSKELFEKYFIKKDKAIPFSGMTTAAKKRWAQIPQEIKKAILENVWCANCGTMVAMQLQDGQMSGGSLVLKGKCKVCGNDVARLVEPEE